MASTLGMGVSKRLFTEKFQAAVTQDTFKNEFHAGDLRGKISKNKFYFYICENGPKTFTTVLKGQFDEKAVKYHFSKPRAAVIMMTTAAVAWLIFSIVICITNGPLGLLGLLAIPIILFPMFRKNKTEMAKLESKLTRLCHV